MTVTIPKKTCALWQIRSLLLLFVICAAVVSFLGFQKSILLPTAIVFAIGSAFIFVYIPLHLRSFEILISKAGICVSKGVFFKSRYVLPNFRLVLVKNISTPLLSRLKVRLVLLKASRRWILIPEINVEDVKILLKFVCGDEID